MKKAILIIVVSILGSLIVTVFAADWVTAKVSTWQWVRKYHIVEPRAPLVINTREEVRVHDTNDLIASLNRSKTKVAAVVQIAPDGSKKLVGAAAVMSADGLFLSSKLALGDGKFESLRIAMTDGTMYPLESVVVDPVSSAVLIKTTASGFSVVSFANADEVAAGQRALLLSLAANGQPYFLTSYISSAEMVGSGVLLSDVPARAIGLQTVAGAIPGQAVFTASGNLIGMWDGGSLIAGSILKELTASYFANAGKITRPVYGFSYISISADAAKRDKGMAGLRVTKPTDGKAPAVLANSPAAKAGLQEGDIITKIGDVHMATSNFPDAVLFAQKPGNPLQIEVYRGLGTLSLSLVPGANP